MSEKRKLNVFEALLIQDNKILDELKGHEHDYDRKMQVWAKRLHLFKKSAEAIPDPIIKEMIYMKERMVLNEISVLHKENTLQIDIAKIISRLDDLEAKFSSNQDQKKNK
jgi:hypothetical protein